MAFEVSVFIKIPNQCILCMSQHMTGNYKVTSTVKPVLCDHSKIDKTNVLKIDYRLMKVESIAECSHGAFCNTFDLH